MDIAHTRLPFSLHTVALSELRGGPDKIPGSRPHCNRVFQNQHWPIPEPVQSSGCRSDDGVWDGGPPSLLLTVLAVLPREDLVAGVTRQIFEGKVLLHIGDGLAFI